MNLVPNAVVSVSRPAGRVLSHADRAHGAAVSPGLSLSNVDRFLRFGLSAPNPDHDVGVRWQKAEEEACALFSGKTTRDALLSAVRARFSPEALQGTGIGGIEIFDGTRPGMGWVDAACQFEGAVGFHHIPYTLQYPRHPVASYEHRYLKQTHPDYFQALKACHDQRKLGIFLHSRNGEETGTLKHEVIHALQRKHGLITGSMSPEIDRPAKAFINRFYSPLIENPPHWLPSLMANGVNGLYNGFKRLAGWVFQVPWILLKGVVTGRIFCKDDGQDSPGKAVRRAALREIEVSKLFAFHGNRIHARLGERLSHLGNLIFNDLLLYSKSYQLDFSRKRP